MSQVSSGHTSPDSDSLSPSEPNAPHSDGKDVSLMPPPSASTSRPISSGQTRSLPYRPLTPRNTNGLAMTDTPTSTAPNSPHILARSLSSGAAPGKARATTLDIPGLTKSIVSPDGRISQRDIGSKLVIVMVGLPARGKSYITGKLARYLNWLQHPTEIFNVGKRRRVATGGGHTLPSVNGDRTRPHSMRQSGLAVRAVSGVLDQNEMLPGPALAAHILLNGEPELSHPEYKEEEEPTALPPPEAIDQSASFFDPSNTKAFQLREQVALDTLDDLLDYLMNQGGSVGIFDATNSTLERRKLVLDHIRQVAGDQLGVLFLESQCMDEQLLESNMLLKLSGPDYHDMDPTTALDDFKKRVALYQKQYVPLGDYEEKNHMAYVQMIDVGRKLITHKVRGFLSVQAVFYLMNFNLAPRQIWVTRHGESEDNVTGQLGGDSSLTPRGQRYAKCLARFIEHERHLWEQKQTERQEKASLPPRSGRFTPPNPEYSLQQSSNRNFCVWTSMLKRSIETGEKFDDDQYDKKEMRMLDELNAGNMEGMTYEEIKAKKPEQYELRKRDKLHYRYPGPGGEGYLDVINRIQKVIIEVERTTDHVLIIGHKAVTRVILAYFKGLKRDDVADLDVPLNVLYMLEPKPYGVDFVAYRYDEEKDWFYEDTDFELRRATNPLA
ncbi:MAG: hypothetical protein Q9227_008731 [Pyrenula ochraceoflavens]